MIWRFIDSLPVHHILLRSAALLVPRRQRPEWLAEWTAELWHAWKFRTYEPSASQYCKRGITVFCLGAFRDAFWLRHNSPHSTALEPGWLDSPLQCVLFLVVLAAVSLFFTFHLPDVRDIILPSSEAKRSVISAHLFVVVLAFLLLPATTSLALGEYPANRHSPPLTMRLRRWAFLGMKLALILPIVFCGTFDLMPVISAGGIRPHGLLVGYILAFRWALTDQRRRCPVCLRLLTNPVRIGQLSQTFLSWSGTELICARGHGVLHVPEIATSCFSKQRWIYLDSSWSGLFAKRV